MGYTYEQRKRPQVPQKTVPERTNASEPVSIAQRFGTFASQNSPSFDLDAVMQARMTTTFGDLSAMRDYTPPAGTHAPLQTGPYTGPVTHAVSGASPSPSAAGPMQATRESNSANREYLEDTMVKEGDEGYDALNDPEKWTTITRKSWLFGKAQRYKARIKRRAYEMDPDELAANQFNPNGDKKLSQFHELLNAPVQRDRNDTDKTYQGRKNRTAWARFQDFGKNKLKETKTEDKKTWDTQSWGMFEIDPLILMPKLKNMARMVNDYPELQGNIGTLERLRTPGLQRNDVPGGGQSKPDPEGQAASGEPKETTYMQTSTTSLYADEADEYKNLDRFKNKMDAYYRMSAFPLRMNADADADTDEMRTRRMNTDERTMRTHSLTQRLEYAGNHEMGHMLNFLLYKEMNRKKKDRNQLNNEDHRYDITANKLVDKALKRSMSKPANKKSSPSLDLTEKSLPSGKGSR